MIQNILLAIRSLIARPLRTLLTTFGIVLGVAVILSINVTNRSTLAAITKLFSESSGRTNLVVTNADLSLGGFDEGILYRIESVAGVDAAVPLLQAQTLLVDDAARNEFNVSFFGIVPGGLLVYGIDPLKDPLVRDYTLAAGSFLVPDSNDFQIVLVDEFAEENNLQLGKSVTIRTPAGNARLKIVGLLAREGPGQLNNGAFGVIPLETAQKIFERPNELDQVDILAAQEKRSPQELEALKAVLQDRLGVAYSVGFPATQGKRVSQMVSGYQTGLNIFSLIAIFAGAFLIYNAFSMTVIERTREIGMLRTLGMTRWQIIKQILLEAITLAVVGSAIGIGLGIFLARGLIRITEVFLAQDVSEVAIPASALVVSASIGIIVTLLATLIPAWQAGRVSPLEALRIRGNADDASAIRRGLRVGAWITIASLVVIFLIPIPEPFGSRINNTAVLGMMLGGALLIPASVGLWEKFTRAPVRRMYGREGQLGSRNIERSRWRTALTVAALMIGVAMILSIRAVTAAFDRDIRNWIDVYIGGDLFVYSSIPMRNDLQAKLAAVPGVDAVTPIRYLDIKRVKPDGEAESLALTAVDPSSYSQVTTFAFTDSDGDPADFMTQLAGGDTIFVSSVLAEKYGLKQGDILTLKTRRGERDFRIAAIVVDYYNRGMVVQASWRDLKRYFQVNDASAYLVQVDKGADEAAVQQQIDKLYGKRRNLTIQSNQTLKASALNLIGQTSSLFDVLAFIAMIVASLGVVNTMTMNVLERTRELGMLRSLGMTRGQVIKMILAEALLIGVIGGGLGLLFGLLQSRVVISTVNSTAGYDLTYILPTQGIVVSLIIALFVSQLAAILPAARAARLRIIEAIQFE
ncbi:MAG: ABC transporter permease [Anaerolineales bacterium]|nr:ABC transporter permease [Anaerolineales bacterium]